MIVNRIVVGPKFKYWNENHGGNTVVTAVPGAHSPINSVIRSVGTSASATWCVGYLITPDFVVFGKGGDVNKGQRRLIVADDDSSSFGRGRADGYQYAGGVEFTLRDKFSAMPGGLYVSAQYVRSQFDNHTADNHAMGGIAFRFNQAVAG